MHVDVRSYVTKWTPQQLKPFIHMLVNMVRSQVNFHLKNDCIAKADQMYIYKIVFGLLDVNPGTLDISGRVAHPPGREHTAMSSSLKRPTAESMHAVIF